MGLLILLGKRLTEPRRKVLWQAAKSMRCKADYILDDIRDHSFHEGVYEFGLDDAHDLMHLVMLAENVLRVPYTYQILAWPPRGECK